jgi:hypothetical protein
MLPKKSTTLDAEEKVVPIDKADGRREAGRYKPSNGIKIKPAPPPQTALKENAITAQEKMRMSDSAINTRKLPTNPVFSLEISVKKFS